MGNQEIIESKRIKMINKSVALLMLVLLLSLTASAGPFLAFIAKAHDEQGRKCSVYFDMSTKHAAGKLTTIEMYSSWETPVAANGYSKIKWYENTLQVDCNHGTKQTTYLAYLDAQGGVLMEKYQKTSKERFADNDVDNAIQRLLCEQK
jgi:ABC-type uncharacterized transport system YnjBCD substrate-binding protein